MLFRNEQNKRKFNLLCSDVGKILFYYLTFHEKRNKCYANNNNAQEGLDR